ncbi:hypothetical protein Agabi119p4_7972 [Agaricus bisporus var. burnettii]|uniref:CBS domain-containing protein n=1 Tax=Agaricus bisporus var. burnettii TaxID=192524 RepID=A0A8H7C6A5_AGABI|nr:hypothetical protein Agabi119p4_7972 [Agaricus bisporus var. burnettii]
MSSNSRRLSFNQPFNSGAFYSSQNERESTDSLFGDLSEQERDALIGSWKGVYARDIIESKVVTVDANIEVEEACNKLLSESIDCLVIVDSASPPSMMGRDDHRTGLFDFSDVNAFLTLAATRHTLPPDIIRENARLNRVVEAAKAGKVPVRLVSNFSDKNPCVVLPYNANVISLLEVFARGTHRVFVQNTIPPVPGSNNPQLLGMVTDKGFLSWFAKYAKGEGRTLQSPLGRLLSRSLYELAFPLLNIHTAVVAASSVATVLDAMRLMSEDGVSSVAVLDEESGILLGAVSVTDIGQFVVPSQTNHILGTPLKQFVSTVRLPYGSTDGADRYPVYSVFPSSSLVYTIEKLLATNAHRLFVTGEAESANPVLSPSSSGNLTGIISIVDILSLFAHLARIPDVDPRRMQRHRRASSTSSHSSDIEALLRTRSSSRASIRRSPSFGMVSSSPGSSVMSFSGNSSPVSMRPKSPGMLPVPDIGGALGGSLYGVGIVGRRGSMNASLRSRNSKRDSVQ